jgi:hypothetical protein
VETGVMGEHESLSRIPFTSEDEAGVASLAWWMRLLGYVSAFSAMYMIILFVQQMMSRNLHLTIALHGLLALAVAYWALRGSSAFQKVVTTDQADQSNLVEGLTNLRSMIVLKSVLILIGLLVPIVAMLTIVVLSLLG